MYEKEVKILNFRNKLVCNSFLYFFSGEFINHVTFLLSKRKYIYLKRKGVKFGNVKINS